MMRKLGWLVALVMLASCKKGGGSTADGGATEGASVLGGEVDAFLRDENAPLTPAIEEKLLLGLKDCNVTDAGIESSCEGLKRWDKSRGRKTAVKQLLGGSNSLGARYIGDASPAIRFKAADLMSSMLGADASTQKIIVDAAKKEQVPAVLANMIQAVGSKHKGNADITQLLMTSADHPSERVRTEAMGWFLTSFGQGVPGTFEKVTDKLAKDPSLKLRGYLCSRLYGSQDERALPLFESNLLTNKATPVEVYTGCWNGVIAAWTGFPKPEKPSQKAYELTLKVLESTPRTKERPPWSGMSTLRASTLVPKPGDTFGLAWVNKVKPWYKQERLFSGLEAVAVDPNANWMARTAAIDVLKELEAPLATLERIQKKYAASASGDDSLVKKKVEDVIAKR